MLKKMAVKYDSDSSGGESSEKSGWKKGLSTQAQMYVCMSAGVDFNDSDAELDVSRPDLRKMKKEAKKAMKEMKKL